MQIMALLKKCFFLKHLNLENILYVCNMRLIPKHNFKPGTQQYLHPNKTLVDRGYFEFTTCAFKNAVRRVYYSVLFWFSSQISIKLVCQECNYWPSYTKVLKHPLGQTIEYLEDKILHQ